MLIAPNSSALNIVYLPPVMLIALEKILLSKVVMARLLVSAIIMLSVKVAADCEKSHWVKWFSIKAAFVICLNAARTPPTTMPVKLISNIEIGS